MLKPIRNISNPMTIIGLFALISETSATASLPFLENDEREVYIWFLISFPFYLMFLFFITLNFNARSLYAPSDFKKDDSFLKSFKSRRTDENQKVVHSHRTSLNADIEDDAPPLHHPINTSTPPSNPPTTRKTWDEGCIQLSKSINKLYVIDARQTDILREFDSFLETLPQHHKKTAGVILFVTDNTTDVLRKHLKQVRKRSGTKLYIALNVSTQITTML